MNNFIIKNPSGQKITGLIDLPAKVDQPLKSLIFCHGFKGFKEQKYLEYIADYLSLRGIAVFRFDFTNGIGESEGDIYYISTGHYLEDLKSVFDYVSQLDYINQKAVSLAGASFGGMVAILLAAENPAIKSLILQAPVFKPAELHPEINLNQWQKQGYWTFHSNSKNLDFKVGFQFYSERVKYDLLREAAKIKAPTLIIHGSEDESIPLKHSQELFDCLKVTKKLFVIPGGPHDIKQNSQLKLYADRILDWLKNPV